jgi:uncharacterized coiled-coil protein SlyX
MNDERLAHLEERLSWLQRHATEQDKAIMDLSAQVDRLKKQVTELREKLTAEVRDDPGAAQERPPHY